VTACLWGFYNAASYNVTSNTWGDLSGNGRHRPFTRGAATIKKIQRGSSFSYVAGNVSAGVQFFTDFQGATGYTLFHISRWDAGDVAAAGQGSRCLRRVPADGNCCVSLQV
jgi:hypothetical protein